MNGSKIKLTFEEMIRKHPKERSLISSIIKKLQLTSMRIIHGLLDFFINGRQRIMGLSHLAKAT